mgnify:FL=1
MRRFWLFILLLTACQTTGADYSDYLRPWVGQSEERLLQSWGMPQNVLYVTPREKVLTYVQFSNQPRDENPNPYPDEVYYPAIATPDFGFPNQPSYSDYYCQTLFTITGNIVTDYSFNGDACVVE